MVGKERWYEKISMYYKQHPDEGGQTAEEQLGEGLEKRNQALDSDSGIVPSAEIHQRGAIVQLRGSLVHKEGGAELGPNETGSSA